MSRLTKLCAYFEDEPEMLSNSHRVKECVSHNEKVSIMKKEHNYTGICPLYYANDCPTCIMDQFTLFTDTVKMLNE